jgi:hypothetical protein
VVLDVCRAVVPQFLDSGGGHFVACHRINPVGGGDEPAGLVERRAAA